MANFNPMSNTLYHVRSASLPARSHPIITRIEQQLNHLQTLESLSSSNATSICTTLSGIEELYKSIEELLNLPLTQQAHHPIEKWVKMFLEGSVKYIDVCSKTRDAVMLMKEDVRQLQSSLRRKNIGDLKNESNVSAYISSSKTMKKEISKSMEVLKHADNKLGAFQLQDSSDHHLAATFKVLREASLITAAILQSSLLFLSEPVLKPKPSRWALVSKLVHKSDEVEKIESAEKRLDAFDSITGGLEYGLDRLFRRLINVRVSLLNIISH